MSKNSSVGVAILIVGVVILLGKTGVIPFMWSMMWPLFLLVPGVLFHMLHFARIWPAGVLVPGGILSTYGILFLICNVFGWWLMAYLWPTFLLGVAIGLYELYLFERSHPRGLVIAAAILAGLAVLFYAFMMLFGVGVYALALLLIVGGAILIYRKPNIW